MRRGHPRRKFQFDQLLEVTIRIPSISIEALDGFGKDIGFGLPSPGNSPLVMTSMVTRP